MKHLLKRTAASICLLAGLATSGAQSPTADGNMLPVRTPAGWTRKVEDGATYLMPRSTKPGELFLVQVTAAQQVDADMEKYILQESTPAEAKLLRRGKVRRAPVPESDMRTVGFWAEIEDAEGTKWHQVIWAVESQGEAQVMIAGATGEKLFRQFRSDFVRSVPPYAVSFVDSLVEDLLRKKDEAPGRAVSNKAVGEKHSPAKEQEEPQRPDPAAARAAVERLGTGKSEASGTDRDQKPGRPDTSPPALPELVRRPAGWNRNGGDGFVYYTPPQERNVLVLAVWPEQSHDFENGGFEKWFRALMHNRTDKVLRTGEVHRDKERIADVEMLGAWTQFRDPENNAEGYKTFWAARSGNQVRLILISTKHPETLRRYKDALTEAAPEKISDFLGALIDETVSAGLE